MTTRFDGQIALGAGLAVKVTEVANAAYSATVNDQLILVTTGNTTRTVTLPVLALSHSVGNGQMLHIVKVDSGSGDITIEGAGAETVNGSANQTLAGQWASCTLIAGDDNWVMAGPLSTTNLALSGTLSVAGATSTAALTSSGLITAADLTTTDDIVCGDDLTVTGAAAVTETLTVTGATAANGGLTVGTSFQCDGTAGSGLGMDVIKVATKTVGHADLTTASATETEAFSALPANCIILGVAYKLGTAFSGGTVSAITMQLGDGSDADRFSAVIDCFTGASTTFTRVDPTNPGGASDVFPLALAGAVTPTLTFSATGDDVVSLTAGSVTWYVTYIAMDDPAA